MLENSLLYGRLCAARLNMERLRGSLRVLTNAILHEEFGQGLVEYALVVSLIALGAVAGMSQVARVIVNAFSHLGTKPGGYTS
jgi:Flp pilus assembly pilin Flp